MGKVAVLFGGKSCEREISVLTGIFVTNLLESSEYAPLPIYIHTNGEMYSSSKLKEVKTFENFEPSAHKRIIFDGKILYEVAGRKSKLKRLEKIDVALNCCHGGLGEGGGVSALMAWNDIPFASPDLTSSSVFMNKSATKLIMRALNIPTVDYIRVNEQDYEKRGAFLLKNIGTRLKYPVIVKPSNLGSSIGIALANNENEAKKAIEEAFALDTQVIIERYLENKQDVNCAAYLFNGEIVVSEPEKAFGGGVYSFEEKYVKKSTEEIGKYSKNDRGRYALKGEMRDKIRSYTKTIYKRMNMQGVVRMDFLLSEGKVYLCEVNTVPGSLAYYLFCERITDAKRFFKDLLSEAIRNHEKNDKEIITTGILQTVKMKRK